MFNDFANHWKFWLVDFVTLDMCRYIHPNKQQDVQILYNYLLKQDNITLFVVFGSAVTINCHSYSDIDIYLETKDGQCKYDLPYSNLRNDIDVVVNIADWSYGVAVDIAKHGIAMFDRR